MDNANPVTYTDPTGLFSAAEAQAAANIANTLAGIQWESGGYLISATLARGNYGIGDLLLPIFGVAGLRYDRERSRITKKHQQRIKINGMS